MIEREKVGRSAAPAKSGKATEPSEAEVVAAARALWRFDLCGVLLDGGEHVLCDDARVPARKRHSRCPCRDKSRALLKAAAAKRPKPQIEKHIVDKAIADKVIADNPTANEAVANSAPAEAPVANNSGTENAAPDKPAASEPAAEKPALSPAPAACPDMEAPSLPQAPSVVPPHGEPIREPLAWQPIATAPRPRPEDDGKRVLHLLFDPKAGVTPGYWVADPWGGGDWFGTSASIETLHPTHWMPLPDPP
ncbi:MAG: DUF551 domain-containing protein [Rhizobiales bacterium]|nr:DUF551 domain-containing protein [Hyphomicrobiales bacterium]